MPDFATGKIEQSAGIKSGSGFISDKANNTIIAGKSADKNEIPPAPPPQNSEIPANPPRPPVAKADSDIAAGHSACMDGSADDQSGAPSVTIGNAAVAEDKVLLLPAVKPFPGERGGALLVMPRSKK